MTVPRPHDEHRVADQLAAMARGEDFQRADLVHLAIEEITRLQRHVLVNRDLAPMLVEQRLGLGDHVVEVLGGERERGVENDGDAIQHVQISNFNSA